MFIANGALFLSLPLGIEYREHKDSRDGAPTEGRPYKLVYFKVFTGPAGLPGKRVGCFKRVIISAMPRSS
jgi:hypothetical protein